jgi:hypothetical protein
MTSFVKFCAWIVIFVLPTGSGIIVAAHAAGFIRFV